MGTRRVIRAVGVACLIWGLAWAQVVIDEIHYDPPVKTVPEEFVELHNAGATAVDISGWYFSSGISFEFPPQTSLPAGGFVVVAEDPQALTARFGAIPVFGPFTGRLDNDGDHLILRDARGALQDEVDYDMGFPWPTAGGDSGFSIELLNPALDNDLGGHWRLSTPSASGAPPLIQEGGAWRYRKGTEEASNPTSAWRALAFGDSSWSEGTAPLGYGESFISTPLGDMQGGYACVFLRKTFQVDDPANVRSLALECLYDDGFNAWVNGVHVARANLSADEMAHDQTASNALEDLAFQAFALPDPAGFLRSGENVLAIQFHNSSMGGSSDAFFDARLTTASGEGAGPTPGRLNSVHVENAPPALRQVEHAPSQPSSGSPVLVTVKATDSDGVAAVTLSYQVVEPGDYIQLEDARYETEWTTIAMNDSGSAGDEIPGDDTFSATLPASVQAHRRLIRYRISARDSLGLEVRVPYADDPQPNFAYFVHDGLPGWSGAIQPGSSDVHRRRVLDYASEVVASIPAYFLITKESSTEDCTWYSQYQGENYLWRGTFVYEGEVYDHVQYRARGGVWRYSMGKNMWKFNFLRGHSFEARDDFGRPYDTRWDKLNFSAIIQQGDYLHRGEQGLFESVGFKLFDLAGVEACRTHFLTFHIVDAEEELGPTQYDGDLWGLYLALEQPDGRFLDEHRLPDGNLYKMEGGTGELNNQGPSGATDKSDLNSFQNTFASNPQDAWWIANFDLGSYYSYRSIVECIHHYDIGYGKNYFYYLNPETGRWRTIPWDLDLTWADSMFGNGEEPFRALVLSHSAFSIAYKNRMREVRDLLYNTQATGAIIDELAALVDDPMGGPALVDLDRSRWDYNPIMIDPSIINPSKAGHGRFYERATTRDFPGMVTLMKNYVVARGNWIDSSIAADAAIPGTPTATSTAPAGFPLDRLSFRTSAFSDPQGSGTFGAMEWRVAEVTPAGTPVLVPGVPRIHEIRSTWQSGEISPFASEVTLPANALRIGSTYRVRVRHMDSTGRWSHWSPAVEFVAGPPTEPFSEQEHLRITEIMYHPGVDEELEFIEFFNTGSEPLDLDPVSLSGAVEFRFAEGSVHVLAPGEYAVIVSNSTLFRSTYDTSGILLAGEYEGRLSNGGEAMLLAWGGNADILDFAYADTWYPTTDGGGRSLIVIDPLAPAESWGSPAAWTESPQIGGSPGLPNGTGPVGGLQLPGDANQDGALDISDSLSLLFLLFGGSPAGLPCDGALESGSANASLLDASGDGGANLSDAVYLLDYLFREGPPPTRGTRCIRIVGCPDACRF